MDTNSTYETNENPIDRTVDNFLSEAESSFFQQFNKYIVILTDELLGFKREEMFVSWTSIHPFISNQLSRIERGQWRCRWAALMEPMKKRLFLYDSVDGLFDDFDDVKTLSPEYLFISSGDGSGETAYTALMSDYILISVIEIEGLIAKGLLFEKRGIQPSKMAFNPSTDYYAPLMIYKNDKGFVSYPVESRSPKFVYNCISELVPNRTITTKDIKPITIEKGRAYYYIDKTADDSLEFRFITGDRKMKRQVRRTSAKFDIRHRAVTSPAIIIDLDSFRVIGYFNKDTETPFLLDEHHYAMELTKDYLKKNARQDDDLTDRKKPTVYSLYRKAAERLNPSLLKHFTNCEGTVSNIPGAYYHAGKQDRILFLMTNAERILTGKKKTFTTGNNQMLLSPCDFDLRPYLKELEDNGIIEPEMSKDDNRLRYKLSEKTSLSEITLFSFIMNCKIADVYQELKSQDQIIWDYSYHETFWEQKIVPQWIVDTREKKYTWRDSNEGESKIYIFEKKKDKYRTFAVNPKKQFRIGYFARLFNIDENSIRTLKSTAVDPLNVKNKPALQNIIKYIYTVDRQNDEKTKESTSGQ
jgi:hypothetical protein